LKLLILGGTRFLGRHLVDAALGRGHGVTIFTRGVQPVPSAERVRHLAGNRDPRIAPGLVALAGGMWDAAIDLSGYVPRCVNASCAALEDAVAHYTFVSSVSVYADVSRPGVDETAPVAKLDDPSSEDLSAHYGALKARCEGEVRSAFGNRALIVRPGLIVGPFDPTDRFGYWVARFVFPQLLGARNAFAVVPRRRTGSSSSSTREISRRGWSTWWNGRQNGTFDACTPAECGRWERWSSTLRRARAPRKHDGCAMGRRRNVAAARRHPMDRVALWIPARTPSPPGFMHLPCARAIANALRFVPLDATDRRHRGVAATARQLRAWRSVAPPRRSARYSRTPA
jgi:2'-hydroxyisoflavone reductase